MGGSIPHHDIKWIAVYSALGCVAALAFPVVFSSDVYAYALYGWMPLHGIDPYAHQRLANASDPFIATVIFQWGNPPPVCVYGPAFVWFAQTIMAIFGGISLAAPLWAFRIASCCALVACAPLAYAAFKPCGPRARIAAAAGIALNPLAVWSCAEGHNDVFIVAIALAGFALIGASRAFSGALLLALSPLVKLPGLAAAVIAFVMSVHDRKRVIWISSGVLLGAALSAALLQPLIGALSMHVAGSGHYSPQFSLQSVIATVAPPAVTIGTTCALALAVASAGIWLLLRRRSSSTLSPMRVDLSGGSLPSHFKSPGIALLTVAVWIAIPNPYPWYALWFLPVAFVAWESAAAWAIIALTLCVTLRYYAEASFAHFDPAWSALLAALQLVIPAGVFIAGSMFLRQDRPESHTQVPDLAFDRCP